MNNNYLITFSFIAKIVTFNKGMAAIFIKVLRLQLPSLA